MKKRVLIILSVIVAAVAVISLIVYLKANRRFSGEETYVYVPRHATAAQLGDSLQSALGVDYGSNVFDIWKRLPGDAVVHSGAYKVSQGDKVIEVAKKLHSGRQTPVKLVFNNVRTLDDLAKRIDRQMDLSADEFLSTTDSIPSQLGVSRPEYAAHFLPDTYEVYWDEDPEQLVNRLISYYGKFWTPERQAKARELGLTPAQVSTLASIVEEETTKRDERGMVARLYLNRLDRNMKLQADPTVKFATGDFSLRRILGSHLKIDSPYNTYRNTGLPPGPIRIPEAATLDAVLNAPSHDYLYMCAKSDFSGYHDFAVDYAAHKANARKYQAALNRRGIRR